MNWKSEGHRYGAVAMAMHWATAGALLFLLGSGLLMERLADDMTRLQVLRAHVAVGALVLLLTLTRIGWWLFADRRPSEPAGMPRWQAKTSNLVHRLSYAAILIMGASGFAMLVLSGVVPILIAGQPDALPDFQLYPPRAAHGLVAWVLIALIAVHVAAALYHQFVLRDRLLARMGIGQAG
ncbi:MAG: cytochrome b [Rhizobiaceae bacterium]|nr:cytochrome b [Rhizobiaceae bacterium]